MTAFSSWSTSGGAPGGRAGGRLAGSASHWIRHSANTCAASGSSSTPSALGPARTRCAPRLASKPSANPAMTPAMSFIRSQREIWTTSGASRGGGPPSRTTVARCRTTPRRPFARRNPTVVVGEGAVISPAARSIPRTSAPVKCMFLVENGLIDGKITWIRSPSTHSGAKRRLEKTKASTSSRCGCRKRHDRSVHSLDRSDPTWHRQTIVAPSRRNAGARPAVCGSCRMTMSPGRTSPSISPAFARNVRSYASASAAPSGPPSPEDPYRPLWIRFVTSKNAGSPSITNHRVATPPPRA